jgi:hypothetical protein
MTSVEVMILGVVVYILTYQARLFQDLLVTGKTLFLIRHKYCEDLLCAGQCLISLDCMLGDALFRHK